MHYLLRNFIPLYCDTYEIQVSWHLLLVEEKVINLKSHNQWDEARYSLG